jgi:hypothetical protein
MEAPFGETENRNRFGVRAEVCPSLKPATQRPAQSSKIGRSAVGEHLCARLGSGAKLGR